MRNLPKTSLILRIVSILLVVLSISGCNNVSRQRSMAIDGVKGLQRAFNNRDCGMIYDGGDVHFQTNQRREDWISKCDALRDRLGSWESFSAETNNSWPIGGIGVVWVQGPAMFASGRYSVRADWAVKGDQVELFNLQIEGGRERVDIPGFSGRFR
jgi:hypothetical protein